MSQSENEIPQSLKEYKQFLEGRTLSELKELYRDMDKSTDSERANFLKQHIETIEVGQALEPDALSSESSADVSRITNEEILEHIRKPSEKQSSIGNNLILLIVSLMIFAGAGLFEWKPIDLGIIIIVLLIHELGHLLAMKAFKYKDVKMFFLPLVGAAVSGKEGTPYESRKALVSLLGPFPGILIGIGLAIWYSFTKETLLFQASTMFVFINAFNLLPLYPLDGGRFLDAILFSRNFTVEAIFKVITSLLLALLAISIEAWLLLILPVTILLSLHHSFHASKAAKYVRSNLGLEITPDLSLTEEFIGHIRESLSPKVSVAFKTSKHFAGIVESTWNRIFSIKPKFLKTSFLLGTYLMVVLFSGTAAFTLIGMNVIDNYDKILTQELNADSVMVSVEKTFKDSILISTVELDTLGYFHGSQRTYREDGITLERVGTWYHGKWDEEWTSYDSLSNPFIIATFDKGKFLSKKEFKNGEWKVTNWEGLSKIDQSTFTLHHEGKPMQSSAWLKENRPH